MGTSKTSSGPGKNVPLVPSWVASDNTPPPPKPPSPPLTAPDDGGGSPSSPSIPPDKQPEPPPDNQNPEPQKQPVSPPRRFTVAKRAVGDFVKSGDERRLRKALGSYARDGYGGSSTATQRMSKAASAASGVYNLLSPGQTTGNAASEAPAFDLATLAGLSHGEIADRIADAVNPGDVSLDDAGTREAIAEAISSVLGENEDADVTNLPAELAEECYVRTLSISAFKILVGDIGAAIWRAAHGNAPLANERLKDISDYLREVYRAQYVKMKELGMSISRNNSARIAREITALVMDTFESYLE